MDVSDVIFGLCLLIVHIQPSLQGTLTTVPCSSDSVCKQRDVNAVCNTDNGYCNCKDTYKEDPTSAFCSLKVLNRPCVGDNDCLLDGEFVECNHHNVCVCQPGYGHYQDNDICDKVLGRPCFENSGCTIHLPNTTCFLDYAVFMCSCEKTHIPEDDVCKLKLGGRCSSDDECVNFAECDIRTDTCHCSFHHPRVGEYCSAGASRLRHSLHKCGWLLALLMVLPHVTWM